MSRYSAGSRNKPTAPASPRHSFYLPHSGVRVSENHPPWKQNAAARSKTTPAHSPAQAYFSCLCKNAPQTRVMVIWRQAAALVARALRAVAAAAQRAGSPSQPVACAAPRSPNLAAFRQRTRVPSWSRARQRPAVPRARANCAYCRRGADPLQGAALFVCALSGSGALCSCVRGDRDVKRAHLAASLLFMSKSQSQVRESAEDAIISLPSFE